MSLSRTGALVAWAAAYFRGSVSIDEVVDAATGSDAPHLVSGLPASESAHLRELLAAWRRDGAAVRLVLPVPGDVRGLPGPPPFRAAALDAGEAAVSATLSAVPRPVGFAPSSAAPSIIWRVFQTTSAVADHPNLGESQHELTVAIRESASALLLAGVGGAGARPGTAPDALALHATRHAGEHLNLPPTHPPRAVALLSQAERIHAALELALQDPSGGAVDRTGMDARAAALRPLGLAVRRALMAGYNAGADEPR